MKINCNLVLVLILFFSQTSFAQWVLTSGPISPASCFAKNSSFIFAGTSSVSSFNGVYRTNNQGLNWNSVNSGVVNGSIADIINVGEAILIAQYNEIYISLDNGSNWSSISSNIGSYPITCLASRGNEIFAAGNGIYKSNNLGITWTTVAPIVSSASGNTGLSVFGDTIFVGKLTNGLWRSIDNGASFQNVGIGITGTGITNVLKTGNVYYVGSSNGIYKSINGGSNWQLVTLNVTSVNNIIISNNILFASTNNGVCFSINEGNQWFSANDGLTNIQVLSIFSDNLYLYAGVQSSVVHKRLISDFNSIPDTCNVTIYDTTDIAIYDTLTTNVFDTSFVNIIDTTEFIVYDTLTTNLFDTTYVNIIDTTEFIVYDTLTTNLFDTTYVNIIDTTEFIVYDTLTTNLFDTTYVIINDTINTVIYDTVLVSVSDTLIINTLITNSGNSIEQATIKIYPNPANSELFIESTDYMFFNNHIIRIYNSLGQVVFEQNFNQNPLISFIGNWGGNGIYFLHLIDSIGNTLEIKKIVLQN